jgi:hypothetical protein
VHPKAGWQHQTFALDLGLGGARIVLDDQVVVGEELTVSFTAPALWDPLVLKARVAWASPGAPYHVGVAFRHHSAEAAFALYELIVSLGYE